MTKASRVKSVKQKDWVWMPHAGHFIASAYCRFHLNTYVNGYIVSTVGELWWDQAVRRIHAEVHDPVWYEQNKKLKGDFFDAEYMKRFGYEDIGLDGKYETMVFKGRRDLENRCCPYCASDYSELELERYNTAKDATLGHYKLCRKYAKLTKVIK